MAQRLPGTDGPPEDPVARAGGRYGLQRPSLHVPPIIPARPAQHSTDNGTICQAGQVPLSPNPAPPPRRRAPPLRGVKGSDRYRASLETSPGSSGPVRRCTPPLSFPVEARPLASPSPAGKGMQGPGGAQPLQNSPLAAGPSVPLQQAPPVGVSRGRPPWNPVPGNRAPGISCPARPDPVDRIDTPPDHALSYGRRPGGGNIARVG